MPHRWGRFFDGLGDTRVYLRDEVVDPRGACTAAGRSLTTQARNSYTRATYDEQRPSMRLQLPIQLLRWLAGPAPCQTSSPWQTALQCDDKPGKGIDWQPWHKKGSLHSTDTLRQNGAITWVARTVPETPRTTIHSSRHFRN